MMEQFNFQELELSGAYLIRAFHNEDLRGGFVKDYNRELFQKNGIDYDLKETFYTISKKGVIRAIHFQLIKQQPKLVRCVSGKVFDIIVDLRPDSKTFKKWMGFYLSGENYTELLIPAYFGHGYLVLEDSIVSYKASESFFANGDSGIMYDDPAINVTWPFDEIGGKQNLIISDKDKNLLSLDEYAKMLEQEEFYG